ncbi:MAG: hypothetical protein ACN6O3_09030 [Comamonas sp.]
MDTVEDLPNAAPELLEEEFEKLARALRSGQYAAMAHISPQVKQCGPRRSAPASVGRTTSWLSI